MDFATELLSSRRVRTQCAVMGVYEQSPLSGASATLDEALKGRLSRIIKQGDFTGRLGDTLLLPDLEGPIERVLLVGMGTRTTRSGRSYRRAVQAAAQALLKCSATDALMTLACDDYADIDVYYRARYTAEILLQSHYRIPNLNSARPPKAPALTHLRVLAATPADRAPMQRGLQHGAGIAAGAGLSKDLANLPANVCTPTYLGQIAKGLAKTHRRIRTRVLAQPELKRLKMGSFLSVTRGSAEPARLIVVEYRGGKPGAAPIALVGKGVTFDTGGISLKDPGAMDEMKFDMTGAASVLGTLKALAVVNAPINAVAIIAACENMPGSRATNPGDIVTSMAGLTIEVLNTDAEGRLILCDALTYSRRFKPAVVIDVATLTGACVIALGAHRSGLMSNDDALADDLLAAGQRASDPCWRMPLGEEYQEQLKSNFADLANIGGREAGAVTAACFLWKFVDGLKWAHLDIAGSAWVGGANKGSTGRPVALLVDYLLSRA